MIRIKDGRVLEIEHSFVWNSGSTMTRQMERRIEQLHMQMAETHQKMERITGYAMIGIMGVTMAMVIAVLVHGS